MEKEFAGMGVDFQELILLINILCMVSLEQETINVRNVGNLNVQKKNAKNIGKLLH